MSRSLIRRTCVMLAMALLMASPLPVAGQDWFRQRTYRGETAPVTPKAAAVQRVLAERYPPQVDDTTRVFTATSLPLSIPDSPAPAVTSTIAVPAIAGVTAITVSLNITHTWRGDLVVRLIAPNGTTTSISDREGGSADNIVVTNRVITWSAGAQPQGNWVLSIQDVAGGDVGQLTAWSLTVTSAGGPALVDLTIALEASPAGDNNGNGQATPPSEQDRWERIIGHFADAVFEMTNGAQKIRQVRVFTGGKNSGVADISWGRRGHPHVPGNGGVSGTGGHVMMYEVFANGQRDASGNFTDKDMLADEPGSGYTMAHEWGHYYLGLYDEYAAACPTDTSCVSVSPSIMNSQWDAVGGNHDWLNFSIARQSGGRFQNTLATWQHFAYGASGWEVLARPTDQDPADQATMGWRILAPRVYYAELTTVAPTGSDTPRIDLPSAAARSDLDIRWMTNRQNVEIIIDRSGSMSGAKMSQAKAAAKLLVDQAVLGQASYGVTAFDSSVTNVHPQSAINDEAARLAVKTAIDGISLGGTTAIGDGARAGLRKLVALNAEAGTSVAFLLSDGQNNAGSDPLSVIPEYVAARIPLFTFAYGSDADRTVLSQMANGTGGRFYFSPTTLAEITAAFQAANLIASSNPGVASGTLTPPAGAGASVALPIDQSLTRLRVTVVYSGTVPSGSLQLLNPSGSAIPPTTTSTTAASETLLFWDIQTPAVGTWRINATAAAAGKSFRYDVTGVYATTGFVVDTNVTGGDAPGPVTITSRLTRGQPIIGATVRASVQPPTGSPVAVTLLDDGVYPDLVANDGTYSGGYLPTAGGGSYAVTVEFSNTGGTATESYRGTVLAPAATGLQPPPPADRHIGESFLRTQTEQFVVENNLPAQAPPTILMQPSSQSSPTGGSVTFRVLANGFPDPVYTWQRMAAGAGTFGDVTNGGAYSNATTNGLTVSGIAQTMAGDQFRCVVSNAAGTRTSQTVALGVHAVVTARPGVLSFTGRRTSVSPALERVSASQNVQVEFVGGTAAWTATANDAWIRVTNGNGTGPGQFTVSVVDPGNQPIGTNLVGSVTVTATGLPAPVHVTVGMSILQSAAVANPLRLRFAGVKNGAGGSITKITPAQGVTVSFEGTPRTWSATGDQPWIRVTRGSGSGNGMLVIEVADPSNTLGGATTASGIVTITPAPGSGVRAASIPVLLSLDQTGGSTVGPFGLVDTPQQNTTGVLGTIGITGWVLDDVGVTGVKIYRNCLPFEPIVNCVTVAGRTGVVFVGDATMVPHARPDVEAIYPDLPLANRAAWGYLLLTNMLPHVPTQAMFGGQGTLTFSVLATDVEGHQTWLGRTQSDTTPTTITLANDTIAKPFGAIDTPGQGETVSGSLVNFGWALTPDADTTAGAGDIWVPTNGSTLRVYIDGVPGATIAYNQCRGTTASGPVPPGVYCNDDVSSIFGFPTPQNLFTARTSNPTRHRNLDQGRGAIGAVVIDTTALSNGLHTIMWGVTDSAGRSEGLGSRYFNVLNANADPAPPPVGARRGADQPGREEPPAADDVMAAETLDRVPVATGPVAARTGLDEEAPWTELPVDVEGVSHVRISQLGRLELLLGPDILSGYLVANGGLRPLPAGTHLDPTRGWFTWAPGVGYLGRYRLAFVTAETKTLVDVTITSPAEAAADQLRLVVDRPVDGATIVGALDVAGWALDPAAEMGPGISTVDMSAQRVDVPGGQPVKIGSAVLGGVRPDVAAAFGPAFGTAGYGLTVNLEPGDYQLTVSARGSRTGQRETQTIRVRVR